MSNEPKHQEMKMYSLITNKPSLEDIKIFKMQENINENFINYKINPNELSMDEKKLFINNYKLDIKVYSYKDFIFLSMPIPTLTNLE
ncbi:hypothetical protein [Sulfurimonas sp.]|uniref:hypothetical protein n=1 Tax=Sulfurimonas sp. TaxID=2022749 RepID=UPI00356912DC